MLSNNFYFVIVIVIVLGREGQLGHGHKKDMNTPVLVESLRDEIIVSVAAGNMVTFS